MKKLIPILLLLSLVILSGCSKEQNKEQNKDQVVLEAPKESSIVTEDLKIQLKGKLMGEGLDYVFYQLEDGHTYLASGRIDRNQDGAFDIQIKLDKPPDNHYIGLFFYADENNDGEFDPEVDGQTVLKNVNLQYQPSS
ncbi:hypothetical protein A7K91_14340 [Paenibacillus oryzae]|uniref:Bacterial spore germination immunoglobulin-like domain-containing protein n=1 Tax=Paenibacillus oryzae TaxID=1844972 RepID=A0A1A5YJF0_9BACL|nr:hypothetical protein [Paenibacillus oryzae]OBR65737.1 hypothetical protein A7K91_14340 [Paenibacillus oryzae]